MEWTSYITSPKVLLNEHPRIAFTGGITCFYIVEVYLPERTVRQLGFVQGIPPPPMRPTKATRPPQGTYSITFAPPYICTKAWRSFPYCARIGDQALCWVSVPLEAVPDYVDWFRVFSHLFLLLGEGPSGGFGAVDSTVEYVSVSNILSLSFTLMLFIIYLNHCFVYAVCK